MFQVSVGPSTLRSCCSNSWYKSVPELKILQIQNPPAVNKKKLFVKNFLTYNALVLNNLNYSAGKPFLQDCEN